MMYLNHNKGVYLVRQAKLGLYCKQQGIYYRALLTTIGGF